MKITNAEELYKQINTMIERRKSLLDLSSTNRTLLDYFKALNEKIENVNLQVDNINNNRDFEFSETNFEYARSYLVELQSIFKRIKLFKSLTPVDMPDIDSFLRTYKWLSKNHGVTGVTFHGYKGFTIHDVHAVLNESDPFTRTSFELDLGKFDIKINFNYSDITAVNISRMSTIGSAHAVPVGSNKPVTIDNATCYHPHIRSDYVLCLGSYREQMNLEIASLNFLSVFQTLCRLINRYNANSLMFAGAYIHNWIGEKCTCCSDFVGDSLVRCANTGAPMHKNCAIKVENEDNYYQPRFIKNCNSCGKTCSPKEYTVISPRVVICSNCEIPE